METLDFFKWLLPSSGQVVLGLLQPEGWFKNKDYDTIEAAAAAAKQYDLTDAQVYIAVNTFNGWYTNDDGKKQIRTQGNVAACRALYDDFDADLKKATAYDTKEEALAGVIQLAKALRLTPTIVDSGGGYHSYIHFDEDISEDTWNELSLLKRRVTTHLGIKADRSVDKDSARVLRPVGCTNKKKDYATPLQVTLLKQGKTYSVDKVREVLLAFIDDNDVKDTARPATQGFGFGVLPDAAPLDRQAASQAARNGEDWHDNVLKLIASWVSKGNSDEEIHGLAALNILDGYSAEETQRDVQVMIDGARSKGYCPPETAPPVDEPTVDDSDVQQATTTTTNMFDGVHIPSWNHEFRWNGVALSRGVKDDDGVTHYRPFCRSFIYPLNRIKDSEGTWVIHWRAKEKNGDWREFFMPMSELAATEQMAKTLASHEVFLVRSNRNARADMAEFAESMIETLQKWRVETKTYHQFGWLEDRTGFVMGTKMITENSITEVLCESSIPPDIQVDFGRSGTLEEWVTNIDLMYNRKGAEPYQFAICHSMGSVLVELMGSSNWHGLPLAFTGSGGTGKTTVAKIACGFYGNPEHMNRQTGEQGSTLNAAIKRIAIMGALPMLLDEFSGRTADELTRTGYALANGRDKERLNTTGKFATVGGQWFKNSFITSNDSILETISTLPAGHRVEATQLRFFEVPLPKGYTKKVSPDITQSFVEHHMDNVYGEACLPYIRFIIKNMDWVRRQITAARVKFNPKSDEDNKERFYRDTIVTALVAGKIAQKLGLVSFDINGMTKWAQAHVLQMRDSRKESNTDIKEHLATFIATLQGRLIVTRKLGNGNSRKEDSSMMLRAPAVGRVCTEDEKAFVTKKSISDWCKENGVAPKAMKEQMDSTGYIISEKSMYIGQGSTTPTGLSRCFELKYNRLFESEGLSIIADCDANE